MISSYVLFLFGRRKIGGDICRDAPPELACGLRFTLYLSPVFQRPEYLCAITAALCGILAFVLPHQTLQFEVSDTYFVLSQRTSLELAVILFLMGAVAYKLIHFLGSEPKLFLTILHYVLTTGGTIAMLTLHSLKWIGITEYVLAVGVVFLLAIGVLIVNLIASLLPR